MKRFTFAERKKKHISRVNCLFFIWVCGEKILRRENIFPWKTIYQFDFFPKMFMQLKEQF